MMSTCCDSPKVEKLFGFPKYDVEDAARTLERARELERAKPGLYGAAIKHLGRKQLAIADVIRAARQVKRKQ
jgi:hypothetical protein